MIQGRFELRSDDRLHPRGFGSAAALQGLELLVLFG